MAGRKDKGRAAAKRSRTPAPKGTRSRNAGRPRSEINWAEFDKLCEIQCSEEEIALWFRCSVDTIARACQREKSVSFAEYSEQKRVLGKAAIRRVQFSRALKGNATMLIWWGKQHLGQSDKQEVDWRSEVAKSGLTPAQAQKVEDAMEAAAKIALAQIEADA